MYVYSNFSENLSDISVQFKNDNICKIFTIIAIYLIAYDDNIAYVSILSKILYTYILGEHINICIFLLHT